MKKPPTDPWLGRWPLTTYRHLRSIFDPIVRETIQATEKRRDFFRELFTKGDLVFDIGANHGLRSRHFLELGARVVAIEPQPHCAAELRATLGTHPRFTLEETALGAKEGQITINVCENCDVLSTVLSQNDLPQRFKQGDYRWRQHPVQMTTLGKLIQKHGLPRFCKIDVEGFELEVLHGLSRPLPSLSLEVMTETLPNIAECCAHMETLAKYRYKFSPADSLAWAQYEWLSFAEIHNYLKNTLQPESWGDLYLKQTAA